ncbi:MAG: hypothetical protein JWN70_2194 [Planctomycetaceae bacterium]|nr:hypothetical protein [Planctomycetaceae bacterium]
MQCVVRSSVKGNVEEVTRQMGTLARLLLNEDTQKSRARVPILRGNLFILIVVPPCQAINNS